MNHNTNTNALATPGVFRANPKSMLATAVVMTALCGLAIGTASAGADTTFDTIYTTVAAWAEGSLGKLFAVSAFIIGMGIGLVKQSAMAIVLGLAFALIMFYGPGIIANIVTFAV